MADGRKVRRILHMKVRTTADASQFLALAQSALPLYQAFGPRVRLLRNVDDPSQFIQEVDYEADEAFELNRQKLASDPTVRSTMQAWRMMAMGAVEVDIYEDVTDAASS
jgi:hypothetical protein